MAVEYHYDNEVEFSSITGVERQFLESSKPILEARFEAIRARIPEWKVPALKFAFRRRLSEKAQIDEAGVGENGILFWSFLLLAGIALPCMYNKDRSENAMELYLTDSHRNKAAPLN